MPFVRTGEHSVLRTHIERIISPEKPNRRQTFARTHTQVPYTRRSQRLLRKSMKKSNRFVIASSHRNTRPAMLC